MAVVKAFKLSGIYCCFYSNDHEPAHFHAKRQGQWHARVFFLKDASVAIELIWGKLSGADTRALRRAIDDHRWALLREWSSVRKA